MTPAEVKQLVERLEASITHEVPKHPLPMHPYEVTNLRLEAASALTLLAQEREELREALKPMIEAIDQGQIDSPDIGGGGGDPTHKWHEEWAYHARAALKDT